MRRFKITSPSTPGYIEALYDADGKLCQISFKAIQLQPQHIQWAKAHIPVQATDCTEVMRQHKLVAEEVEFETTFEDFMRDYPMQRNTHLARAYWPKLTSAIQYCNAVSAVEYRRYCERNPWYKPMLPERYLKTEQYRNDWKKL